MRRAVAALIVTVVAVVLLARFETRAPRTVNPAAAHAQPTPRALAARAATPAQRRSGAGTRSSLGPAMTTPFSVIQVRAFLTGRRLTGVETVSLSGDGPHTEALNARAEPILRAEALEAGSAKIDVVSGATSTSRIWIESLRVAIARGRG
jgi:uncharacterized protein with FMN-binding domain